MHFLCISLYSTRTQLSQARMTVTVIFISLVGLIGAGMSSAHPEYIELPSFAVGQCIKVHYTAPSTGRTTVNLEAADGTVVLHVNYRKNWGGNPSTGKSWNSILILNSKVGGAWEAEQHVENLFTTPGTEMARKSAQKTQRLALFSIARR